MKQLIVHNPVVDGIKVKNEGIPLVNQYGEDFGVEFEESIDGPFVLEFANCGCDGCRGMGDVWSQIKIRRMKI